MIYISTSCLKNPKNMIMVLEKFQKAGIQNVELGSVHEYFNIKSLKRFRFNFLIHNYFPPPKNSFNFNLSSQNESIRSRSLRLAEGAIDLCCEVESPLYTFHAGFTVDPSNLGKPFPKNNITQRKLAVFTYINSVRKLLDFANGRGVKIAMEPNVVQKFNLVNGKNKLCLFADYSEIDFLFKSIKREKLGLLLDLGHTAVTSFWLKYDKDDFVKKCKNKVFAIHLSNNNGHQDQHKSLTNKCWQISKLKLFKQIPIILETYNLTIDQIKTNMRITQDAIS